MTNWRSYVFDLRLLSNGVFMYPIYYGMGFLAYFSQLGETQDSKILFAIPLLALSLCVLTHIGTERSDKVADQIVLEHGGYRRRIKARMWSTLTYNVCFISISFWIINLYRNSSIGVPSFWFLSAIAITFVFSTAGVIVSGAIPHPIAAVVITMGILFAGGLAPTDAYQASSFIGMISSESLDSWFSHFFPFAAVWASAALICLPFALGKRRFGIKLRFTHRWNQTLRVPRWVNSKSTFLTRSFFTAKTNWLPPVALLISLASYTYSSLLIAAKYAELHIQGDLFAIFPGLILVNIIPAALLAKSVQRVEVTEQETFLFANKGEAMNARFLQASIITTFSALALLTCIAGLTNTAVFSSVFIRSLIVVALSTPGLCAIGLLLGDKLKSAPLVAVASFLLTLPEFLVSKFWPQFVPWIPTSVFSALAGGAGPYIQDPSTVISVGEALVPTLAILGTACLWIISSSRRSQLRR